MLRRKALEEDCSLIVINGDLMEQKDQAKSKSKKKTPKGEVKLPQGTTIKINNTLIIVNGPKGEAKKELKNKNVKIEVKQDSIIIGSLKSSKREKKIVGTFRSHINNMVKGVN